MKKHSSQLSPDGCSTDDIWQLVETLTQESYMNLLFLKNIEKIQVYRKKSQLEEPCLHFTLELSEDFLEETQRGRGKTKTMIKRDWKRSDAHAFVAYRMGVKETKCIKSGIMRLKERQWLVCNYIGTGFMKREIIRLSDQLHLIPMVGVAVPLKAKRSDQGHLYCCLPLPLEGKSPSGLPIHINGCFVLNQTRHHIKWSTTDHDGTKNNEIKWNIYLVRHILPNAYINLLLEIKRLIRDEDGTNNLLSCLMKSLPCKHEAEPHWKTLVSEMYKLYIEEELVYTEAGAGRWVQPDEAVYLETNMTQSQRQILHQLLCYLDEPVVTLPDHVISGIEEHTITSLVSPSLIRKALKGQSLPHWMPGEEKLEILKYILSDQQFNDLENIALLPLGTGDFTSFRTGLSREAVYLDSRDHPRSLLPGMDSVFLASIDDYELMQNLEKLAASGHTQLTNFDSDNFIACLPRVSTIKRTQSWFGRIWQYISRQFPWDMSKFEGQPILPVTMSSGKSNHLELQTGRPLLLLVEWREDEALQNALRSLGIMLIRSIDCKEAYNHSQLRGKYILEDNLKGVLLCLQYISRESDQDDISNDFKRKTNDREKLVFQKYCCKIVSARRIYGSASSLLKKLHIFIFQRSERSLSFTSCEQSPVGCKDNMIPHKESVVDLSEDQTRILAQTLGMSIIDITNLIEDYVLPSCIKGRYSDDETTIIMDFIFKNHLTRNKGICSQLANLAFVFTKAGHKKAPGALFDPKDSLIRPFLKIDVVPGTRYMIHIDQLRKLGLKTADTVTAVDIFHFASELGSNFEGAKNIVALLSHRSELLTEFIRGRELGRRLNSVQWVPVKQQSPSDYPQELRWFGRTIKLATPSKIISDDYQYIIGTILPVIACSSDDLARYYNWKRIPDLDHVFQQLQMVYNVCQCRPVTSHILVSKMTQSIYAYIQEMLHKPVVLQLCKKIKDMIWNGDKFISAEKIFTNPPLPNLEPYAYRLPEGLKTFKLLLVQCGMKETCNLIDLLHEIRNKNDPPQCYNGMGADHDRYLAISILNMLSKQNLETDTDNIPIPVYTIDGTFRMCEIKYCVYDESIGKLGFKFVHPDMPKNLVQALKIRTLASQVLEVTHLDFEDFGPNEPITLRLKNILEDYPDGSSVPKELIQNADDAGATEVSFVFDERQHDNFKTTLFDHSMAKCQGPALFEYNNALFTEQDFQNLNKIGGRTKQDQMDKLGRFGLGFNAVYHLTDVPTCISGKYLVMLDPNMSHLQNCVRDTRNPGIRIEIGRKKAVEQFSDQYQPYEGIHGCSILGCQKEGYSFPGTLFRFPLRTPAQAESSEICQNVYDESEMKKLLKLFIKNIDTYLLFTQNVSKITIYKIPKHADSFAEKLLLCSVEKTIQQADTKSDRYISDNKILKIASDMIKLGSIAEITSTTITTIQCVISAVAKTYLKFKNEIQDLQLWLVCQHVSAGIVRQIPKGLEGLPPVSGVAIAISKDGSTYSPRPIENGKFFCFLPLPMKSDLPVHINGSFFVSTNRRHIIEKCSDDKYSLDGTWNEMLLKKVIPEAYIRALEIVTSGKSEFDIWPIGKAGSSVHTVTLTHSLLTRIALERKLCLFTDGLKKSTLSGVAFLKHDDFICEAEGITDCYFQAQEVLRSVVGKQGKIVVDMPASVFESFQRAGLEREFTRGMFTKERFLEEIFLPNITTIERYVRDVIVQMAILSNRKYIDILLQTAKCVPVGLDGLKLLAPSEIIDPRGNAAKIYTDDDGRFPFPGLRRATNGHLSFCSEMILNSLERTGMIKDSLTPGDIFERAESIGNVSHNIGLQRSRKIIQFMSSMIKKGDTSPLIQLKEVMFLPVMAKPKLYPLPWYNLKTNFCKPTEAFISDDQYIVGSVAPVVEKEIFSGYHDVACLLDLVNKGPSLELIQRQLEILLRRNTLIIQSYKSKAELLKCFTSVFNALEVMLRSEKRSSELCMVLNELKITPCILVNNIFVSPTSCAFMFNGHCEPWLCQVPEVIKDTCPNLLRQIGVKEQFSSQDFIKILAQKKLLYDTKPLKSADLDIAVNVAHHLIQYMLTSGIDISELQKTNVIYIPDTKSVLRPCSDLCLFDDEFEADKDANFAHRALSIQAGSIFCKLGVKTSKQHTLTKRTLGIPFGQSENLQNRIRRILSGYPFDTTILKELLQNADDAGATELHFILDPRTHSSKKVFDDGWKSLQGPALCVYNNKAFTKADIEGIKTLGEGSKSEDATKTGQYGVDFNCVYHITDTPTFMTSVEGKGVILVAFDPTCSYVPGATVHEPGKMFVDIDHLRKKFSDVFNPFMTHAFPVHNSTMFRLPLRNCTTEPSAHLLKKNVTADDMLALLKTFEREAGDCLLFLKHLCKVTFSHINKKSGKLVGDYWVNCVSSPEASKKKTQFLKTTQKIARRLKKRTLQLTQTGDHEVNYVTCIADSDGIKQDWVVVQSFGFRSSNMVQSSVVQAHMEGSLGLIPLGGIAGLVRSNKSKISEQSSYRSQKKEKSISMVNAPLNQGYIFCFLPLPLQNNQPVHLNGHFALDYESRGNLWERVADSFKSMWNSLLMRAIIAPAYISFMRVLQEEVLHVSPWTLPVLTQNKKQRKHHKRNIEFYNSFFVEKSSNKYVQEFVDEFYRITHNTHASLFPVIWKPSATGVPVIELFSLTNNPGKQAVFKSKDLLNYEAEHHELYRNHPNKQGVTKILEACAYRFFQVPFYVCEILKRLNYEVDESSPEHVFQFLIRCNDTENPCHLSNLPLKLSESPFYDMDDIIILFKYCARVEDFNKRLQGLPLLVTVDGMLRKFDELSPIFCTEFSHIFFPIPERFMHDKLVREHFLEVDISDIKQVRTLDVAAFSELLPEVLDETYKAPEPYLIWNPVDKMSCSKRRVSKNWLSQVWTFLYRNYNVICAVDGRDVVDHRQVFDTMVQTISEWHLIPAKDKTSMYLLPLKWPDLVASFDNTQYMHLESSCAAFMKFDIPSLCPIGNMDCYNLLKNLNSSIMKPKQLLFAIHMWQNHKRIKIHFDSSDIPSLLGYFNGHAETVRHTSYGPGAIRKMEIFKDCKGEQTALGDKKCFSIPSSIPPFNIEYLTRSNTVLLHSCPEYAPLFKVLQIQNLNTVDVYCNYIFKHFDALNEKQRFVHIKFVCREYRDLEKLENKYNHIPMEERSEEMLKVTKNARILKETLLREIEALPFIPKQGLLCTASAFYDPTNDVFIRMLTDEDFPPDPYREQICVKKMFKIFLRKIGLKSTVTPELLISFALRLEQKATECHPMETDFHTWRSSLKCQSKLLLENLYKCQDTVHSLFKTMSHIAFVPLVLVQTDLEALHHQHCRDSNYMNFVSIADGKIAEFYSRSSDPDLLWATTKLIDSSVDPSDVGIEKHTDAEKKRTWICNIMQIKVNVTADSVVQNVKKVCLRYIHIQGQVTPDQQKTMRRVLTKSYEFLTKQSNPDIRPLMTIPCISVEDFRVLVRPRQAVIDLKESDQIQPYLYKVPLELGAYKKLLVDLGVFEEPTVEQYQDVLTEIHLQSGQEKLTPNELRNSYQAVLGLMILLSNGNGKGLRDDLYFPNEEGFLKKSSELFYIDNPSFADRIQEVQSDIVFQLDALKEVQQSHNKADIKLILNKKSAVFEIFPDKVRPRKLSDALVETLDNQHVQVLQLDECKVASALNDRFNTAPFKNGLFRLISASRDKSADSDARALGKLSQMNIDKLRMNIVVLSKVKTVLARNDDTLLKNSAMEQKCFLECGEDKIVIYLPRNTKDSIYALLAKDLAQIFELPDTLKFPLCAILSCDISEIGQMLIQLEVEEVDRSKNYYGLPKLGTFIPLVDHHLLCEGVEIFYEEEYVGYMIEDLLEDIENPTYIYAQVLRLEKSVSDNKFQVKCTINIGDGILKEVSVLDLYKFYRIRKTSGELAPYAGGSDRTEATQEVPLDQTLSEIREILNQAWRLSENERAKLIKRLIFKWHPDKNIYNQEFCTKVMQFIQSEIKRLHSIKGKLHGSSASSPRYDEYYERMKTRAQQHQMNKEAYGENLSSRENNYEESAVPPSFADKNPQPRVAQRWIMQAEFDLRAAPRDQANRPFLSSSDSYPEWTCFKCHQAAEKAIKGAQYAVDANLFRLDHDLIGAASSLEESSILTPTRELERLLIGSANMRYPNLCGNSIPHKVYTDRMAEQALRLSQEIVRLCKNYILLKTDNR